MKKEIAVLLLLAILSLILGGVLGVNSMTYTSQWRYEVMINAPPAVTWSVWVPAPTAVMGYRFSGTVTSISEVDTIHGSLENVTGAGRVVLTFELNRTSYKWSILDENASECAIDLTGFEMPTYWPTYWVWRTSSDPASNITVDASVTCSIDGLSGTLHGGYGYQGSLKTGWTSVSLRPGDGSAGFTTFWFLISETLMLAGIVMCVFTVILAVWYRRKERAKPAPVTLPPQPQ